MFLCEYNKISISHLAVEHSPWYVCDYRKFMMNTSCLMIIIIIVMQMMRMAKRMVHSFHFIAQKYNMCSWVMFRGDWPDGKLNKIVVGLFFFITYFSLSFLKTLHHACAYANYIDFKLLQMTVSFLG